MCIEYTLSPRQTLICALLHLDPVDLLFASDTNVVINHRKPHTRHVHTCIISVTFSFLQGLHMAFMCIITLLYQS